MALIRLTRVCWLCRGFNKITQKMMKVLGCHQIQSQSRCNPNLGGQVTGVQNQFSQGNADGLVHLAGLDNHIGCTRRDGYRFDEGMVNVVDLEGFGVRQGVTPDQFSKNKIIASPSVFTPNGNLDEINKQHTRQLVNLDLSNQWGGGDD